MWKFGIHTDELLRCWKVLRISNNEATKLILSWHRSWTVLLITKPAKKPRTETAEITDDSHKVKYRHKHKMKQTKSGLVRWGVSNIDVTGKHLTVATVTFFMMLPPEKKSRSKNIHVMIEQFPLILQHADGESKIFFGGLAFTNTC